MCVNSNADNSYISFAYMYCLLHTPLVSYIIISFMNKLFSYIQWIIFFHLFKYSSCIMSRVIWKIWVKFHLHLYLIAYIILICIVTLKGTALYGESTVESKFLWLNFQIKFCLQRFSIIMFCYHIIIVCHKSFSSNIFHSCLPGKHNKILWYSYFLNIGW